MPVRPVRGSSCRRARPRPVRPGLAVPGPRGYRRRPQPRRRLTVAGPQPRRRLTVAGPQPGRRASAPHPQPLRDLGDLACRLVQVSLGAGQQFLRCDAGFQGVVQLAGEQLRPDLRITETRALGTVREPLLQPAAMVRDRGQRRGPRGRQLSGHLAVRRAGYRAVQFRADQPLGPLELADRGLQVHPGHLVRRHGTRRRQRVRDRRQPLGQAGQPDRQRCEIPGQQQVDRPPGVGQHRVPLVLAQLGGGEQDPLQLSEQDLRVHPVLRGQLAQVDGHSLGEPVRAPAGQLVVVPGRADGEPVVVAVLAEQGGQFRPALQQAVHGGPGQRGERGVSIRHELDYRDGPIRTPWCRPRDTRVNIMTRAARWSTKLPRFQPHE